MRLNELKNLLTEKKLLDEKIGFYLKSKIVQKSDIDKQAIKGHIEKAEHNLSFIKDNQKIGYSDWCIVGSYYAIYQSSLALIRSKGLVSKNHDATLCVLIREFYGKKLDEKEIGLLNSVFLEQSDILTYSYAKDKRENASYSTKYLFGNKEVEELRKKAIAFVNKSKDILIQGGFL